MDIDRLIKKATLEKNGAAKEAYRAIKAELLLNASSKNPIPEGKILARYGERDKDDNYVTFDITELDFKIIKKLVKEREEQVSMYEANSRKDLADMYREQMRYLKGFLPPEVSKEKIQEAIYGLYPNGFTRKEMGKVIKEIKEIYPIADGKLVSEVVKNCLSDE